MAAKMVAMMPVSRMPSKVPAPPMLTSSAPSFRMVLKCSTSAPMMVPSTPDEKARLYRALSSTSAISVLTRGNDADDDPALEKFRLFWGPFQSVRKQAELWGSALRSVSSTAKAGEVWVALIVLGVVAMSSLALRAHGLRLGKHGGD